MARAASYLQQTVVNPRFDVSVDLYPYSFVLSKKNRPRLRSNYRGRVPDSRIEPVVLDVGRWSERMTGIVLLLLARDPDGKLSHALDGKQLRFSREGLGISPTMFLSGYRNNCLSVNGFRMGLTKVGKILGAKGEGRVGIAFDVDIVGDDAVLYNVSREKIIGEAAPAIRQELRHAILRGLKETGIYDQLAESTKDVLALALESRTPKADNIARVEEKRLRVMQEEILTAVAGILPSGKWPLGLHRMVAAKLGIPNSWAWTAIGELRRRGVAEKADERQQGGGAQIR